MARAPTTSVRSCSSIDHSAIGSEDEPVTIYYTLDGSRPTFDSPKLQSAGIREGAETLTIGSTTTLKRFSVDEKGNIENNYDPDEQFQDKFNKETSTISGG